MNYLVLARKYRPRQFSEVVGQDSVIHILRRGLDSGRIAHAYLFTGSRGIGKTTLARIMARCLVCEQGTTSTPCLTCVHCEDVSNGRSVDIIEIDGASHNGVQEIRELQEIARYLPQRTRTRIFIIDEVHMLSTGAFNALLKILEEPPAHVKFILATTEAHKIPATILSRCQRYDFKRLAKKTIVSHLQNILHIEGVELPVSILDMIAQAADGGMRDALSLTDQVIAFSNTNPNPEEIRILLGVIDTTAVCNLLHSIVNKNTHEAFCVLQELHNAGHHLKYVFQTLSETIRNASVYASTQNLDFATDTSPEMLTFYKTIAPRILLDEWMIILRLALLACHEISLSQHTKLTADLALLTIINRPSPMETIQLEEAFQQLQSIIQNPTNPIPSSTSKIDGKLNLTQPRQIAQVLENRIQETQTSSQHNQVISEPPQQKMTIKQPLLDPTHLEQQMIEPAHVEAEEPEKESVNVFDPDEGLILENIPERYQRWLLALSHLQPSKVMCFEHAEVTETLNGILHLSFSHSFHRDTAIGILKENGVLEMTHRFWPDLTQPIIIQPDLISTSQKTLFHARKLARQKALDALKTHIQTHPAIQETLKIFGGKIQRIQIRNDESQVRIETFKNREDTTDV